eukprot:TRINITY_DN136250_c0_g1_i1.p1 TRINITY_DN136250_c0_g1~~TRINITY_DN136250_c0_g1_i1.p1  ORF type:complete len:202 (-),score=62.24 TRINITY_DN136250_c0_g1_i1:125-730(-)
MVFEKRIIIDGKDHLLGRLASVVAKELLLGQKVVVVRCEAINISGSLFRNKLKFKDFLNKRCNPQPKKGPFHFRAPSKIFWRTVRGMLPHNTPRGYAALNRMKVFEGVPPPYNTMKKVVVPEALRVLRLAPGRKYCVLGTLSSEYGWKYRSVVYKLENKRKQKAFAHYQRKQTLQKLFDEAKEQAAISNDSKEVLTKFGYN